MKSHNLKLYLEYYQAIERGEKTFEVRYNDRKYEVGDTLILSAWDPTARKYLNENKPLFREVTYVLKKFGMKEGYVCLGLRDPKVNIQDARAGLTVIENYFRTQTNCQCSISSFGAERCVRCEALGIASQARKALG